MSFGSSALSRLRILPRLLVGFGILVLLIAGLAGFAIHSGESSKALFGLVSRFKTNEVLDQSIQKRLFEARMHIWMALGSGDESHWNKSAEAFKIAHEELDALLTNTIVPERHAKVAALKAATLAFEDKVGQLKRFGGRNAELDSAEGKSTMAAALSSSEAVTAIAEPLSESFGTAAIAVDRDAQDQIAAAIDIAIIVGIASILAGSVLSLVIARSIGLPIQSMTRAMGRLAAHDLHAEIVGLGRSDEIGDMADINDTATAIASAVEEQSAATREISRNVQEASRGTQEVSSNISSVRHAANESGAAATQVLSAAGSLSRQADDLNHQVSDFLAGVRAA